MFNAAHATPFSPAANCGAVARALSSLLLLGLIGDRRVR